MCSRQISSVGEDGRAVLLIFRGTLEEYWWHEANAVFIISPV